MKKYTIAFKEYLGDWQVSYILYETRKEATEYATTYFEDRIWKIVKAKIRLKKRKEK